MFELRVESFDVGEVNVKCTPCDDVTKHEWMTVKPTPNEPIADADAFLQEAQLIRRIIMCTNCGNLSLKK